MPGYSIVCGACGMTEHTFCREESWPSVIERMVNEGWYIASPPNLGRLLAVETLDRCPNCKCTDIGRYDAIGLTLPRYAVKAQHKGLWRRFRDALSRLIDRSV